MVEHGATKHTASKDPNFMSIRNIAVTLLFAFLVPVGAAKALMLDTWNVDELQASDDYVDLQFGVNAGATTLTLQWIGGVADTPGSIGIDKLFINNQNSGLQVTQVFVDSIMAANDITSAWLPTNGGTSAGGGFGTFIEKVTASAGTDGIISPLIFVLNGLYAPSSFIANSAGASFAIHARYGNDCSGWAADGGTAGGSGSSSSCGTNPVPEPSAALAFSAGALVVGGSIRRRRR
jgi:hypothetical protein